LPKKRALLRLAVIDTGVGIPREVQQMLFTPFAQGDESTSRRFGGTGLGLSICRRLAEAMEGSIRIESVPGEGATFLLEFTLDVADETGNESPGAAQNNGGSTLMTFPNACVLVAEDQPSGRNVIRRQLSKLGIDPLIVNDGQQAYDVYLAEPVDLIITDCHMPNVNGFELTRMIRRIESGTEKHIPILAFTANALKGEAEFCFAAGMDAYIVKPASLAQLSAKISELLGAAASIPVDRRPERALVGIAGAGIDYQALARMVGEDDEAELRSIVLEYLATAGVTFVRARAALERGDAAELAEAGHAGKGSALNVCAAELAESWRALEEAAKSGDLGPAATHMDELEARFAALTNDVGTA
jgi:CheY-like chemotaxis protein/HPt (histidine-containing phosphotransfer) domain-containing protein